SSEGDHAAAPAVQAAGGVRRVEQPPCPERARAGGPGAHRGGLQCTRDRREAVHQPEDGGHVPLADHGQARVEPSERARPLRPRGGLAEAGLTAADAGGRDSGPPQLAPVAGWSGFVPCPVSATRQIVISSPSVTGFRSSRRRGPGPWTPPRTARSKASPAITTDGMSGNSSCTGPSVPTGQRSAVAGAPINRSKGRLLRSSSA